MTTIANRVTSATPSFGAGIPASQETRSARVWRPLNALGGAAALAVVALVPIQIAIYLVWPPPTDASGYFKTFHDNALVGLLNQDLLLVVDEILMIVVVLALYIALRGTNQAFTAIALALALVGTAVFLASNTAFNMLTLSSQYAAATTDDQRSTLLAAGTATLAAYQGSGFVAGYVLTMVADLIFAIVMLRSVTFGKWAAWVGIVYGVTAAVPPAPALGSVGLAFSMASLPPMIVWLILIARGLFRLNREVER